MADDNAARDEAHENDISEGDVYKDGSGNYEQIIEVTGDSLETMLLGSVVDHGETYSVEEFRESIGRGERKRTEEHPD